MAKIDSTSSNKAREIAPFTSATENNAPANKLTEERVDIALEASFEIEKLCEVLITVCPMNDDRTFYAVRGLSARISQLSEIIMRAIDVDDSSIATDDLAFRLNLKRADATV